MKRIIILGLTALLIACSSEEPGKNGINEGLSEGASYIIDVDNTENSPIGNRFSNVSLWHYLGTSADEETFHRWAEEMPAGWLKENYPWLEEAQIYIASGGSYKGFERQDGDAADCEFDRDLFRDPSDRSVLDDYDFAPLVRACRNMLDQGIRPCLKLHNVPIKYSAHPKIDWFRVNVRPPDDYQVYANYIKALVASVVEAFGEEEVGQWRWYVGTEFDNKNWYQAQDETPESTAEEFLKLYDWSVDALETVLGEHCGPIGSHAMMGGDMYWDPEIFFEHCRSGKNYASGTSGSRLDFFAISVYDVAAVHLTHVKGEWAELEGTDNVLASITLGTGSANIPASGNLSTFSKKMNYTREALDKYGFTDVPVEVSEGGLVYGRDGKWLWHGLAIGGSFDASWTALSYKLMLDNDAVLWSRWPLYRSSGLFHGAEQASTNTLRLIHKMDEDKRIPIAGLGEDQALQAVAGMNTEESSIHVLAVHHKGEIVEDPDMETLSLDLKNLPFDGKVKVSTWRIDDQHSNFWPSWEKDRAEHGIRDEDYYQSRDQADPGHALLKEEHIAFWKSKEKGYAEKAGLEVPVEQYMKVKDGRLQMNLEMPCFSVALIEIEELK